MLQEMQKMQVHYRLSFDKNGIPMMYIFKNCRDFIRTIPYLQYSSVSPEDINTELEDHIADETRYMCMTQPIRPIKKESSSPLLSPLGSSFGGRYNYNTIL